MRREPDAAAVAVMVIGESEVAEIPLSGRRSEEILADVLARAGAPADAVDPSVSWAVEHIRTVREARQPRKEQPAEPAASEEGWDGTLPDFGPADQLEVDEQPRPTIS